MPDPRPIIVIGPERTGTSLVADLVGRWGAYQGHPSKLRKPDDQNPRGYFEYLPIWDFLDEIGVNWWDDGFQEELGKKAGIAENVRKAEEMVSAMASTGRPWVWKDPALSFFLPFWKQIWKNPVFVVTVRNPLDAAASWSKWCVPPADRDRIDVTPANLLRWHYIMSLVIQNTEDTTSKIFVSFDRLLADPGHEASRLTGFLSSRCEEPHSTARVLRNMAGTVRSELWHNRSKAPFDKVLLASSELKDLYRFALAKIEDPLREFAPADYPLPRGWQKAVVESEALTREAREKAGDRE